MKKLIIGGLVGGLIVFGWQSLSWTFLQVHQAEYKQAPNQDGLRDYLNTALPEEGQYFVPRANDGASREEMEAKMKEMDGKPWAVINFHKAYSSDMMMNVVRGLLAALVAAFLVCWVLMKNTNSTFGSTFLGCLFIGIAGYLFIPYAGHIWFQNPGAMTHFMDVLVSWGVCGIWLGWWLNRK
jgi:hypothetical protein